VLPAYLSNGTMVHDISIAVSPGTLNDFRLRRPTRKL
jgi:hypothetical protein